MVEHKTPNHPADEESPQSGRRATESEAAAQLSCVRPVHGRLMTNARRRLWRNFKMTSYRRDVRQLSPKSHACVSRLPRPTLIVWCTNSNMGRVVSVLALTISSSSSSTTTFENGEFPTVRWEFITHKPNEGHNVNASWEWATVARSCTLASWC